MKKLTKHPYAQCAVDIHTPTNFDFISYRTQVISVCNGKINCTGTYSQTTRKQIVWFLREYLPKLCYRQMRDIAGTGWHDIADLARA